MAKSASTRYFPGQFRTEDMYEGSTVPPEPEYTPAEIAGMEAFERFVQDCRLRKEIRKRNRLRRNGKKLL